jgi:vacuolar-type H+-ATPase subunit E/Vma4
MALAELIARLEHDAQLRIEAIEKDADEQVRAREAAAAQAAHATAARFVDEERRQRALAHARLLSQARRAARARELEVIHIVVHRVLDRARELADEVAGSIEHTDVLAAYAEEALSFLEGVRCRLRCPPWLASTMQAVVARHPNATLVADEAMGAGVIAEAEDESVLVDNTLHARLNRLAPELASEIAQRLHDDGH